MIVISEKNKEYRKIQEMNRTYIELQNVKRCITANGNQVTTISPIYILKKKCKEIILIHVDLYKLAKKNSVDVTTHFH